MRGKQQAAFTTVWMESHAEQTVVKVQVVHPGEYDVHELPVKKYPEAQTVHVFTSEHVAIKGAASCINQCMSCIACTARSC